MPKVEITIGKTGDVPGVPVLLDWDESIQQHVDRFMANCIAFPAQRYQPEVSVQDRHALALLKSPYPELPPCKIGEFQWPAGLSRYGRAMYVVDWRALLEIAERAWGYEIEREEPAEGETEGQMIKPDFGPAFNWGSKNDPVNLHFNSDMIEYPEGQEPESGQPAWTKSTDPYVMYALPPIPLSEQYDVWVVKLVDIRYFRLQVGEMVSGEFGASLPFNASWSDIISAMQRMFGPNLGSNNIADMLGEISTFTIDSSLTSGLDSFGDPSRPICDKRIPLLYRFEAAALTLGGRFFYDGYRTLTLRSHNNAREEVTALVTGADAIATAGKETIAGGFSGKTLGVQQWRRESQTSSGIDIIPSYFFDLVEDDARAFTAWNALESTWAIHFGADDTPSSPDWRTGVRTATTAKFNTFKAAYAGRVEYWNEIEYCLTYPGVFEYRKCAYTDYYSIVNDGRDCYTIIKSLPIDWRPRCLYAQPKKHFRTDRILIGTVRNVGRNLSGDVTSLTIQAFGTSSSDLMTDESGNPVYVRGAMPRIIDEDVSVGTTATLGLVRYESFSNSMYQGWVVLDWACE